MIFPSRKNAANLSLQQLSKIITRNERLLLKNVNPVFQMMGYMAFGMLCSSSISLIKDFTGVLIWAATGATLGGIAYGLYRQTKICRNEIDSQI